MGVWTDSWPSLHWSGPLCCLQALPLLHGDHLPPPPSSPVLAAVHLTLALKNKILCDDRCTSQLRNQTVLNACLHSFFFFQFLIKLENVILCYKTKQNTIIYLREYLPWVLGHSHPPSPAGIYRLVMLSGESHEENHHTSSFLF